MSPQPNDTADGYSRKQHRLRGLAALLVISVLTTAAVSWMERGTREPIVRNEQARALQILTTVLAAGSYDNQPALEVILLTDPALLGSKQAQPAYTARAQGEVVTSVLTVTAPSGYVGPIRLLVGIDGDGRITGVRALEHQETPGLGDRIDADKGNWIRNFAGRQLDDAAVGLALRLDGGDIDHISGATITSRAVTNAVANALRYQASNQQLLLAPAAPAPDPAATAEPGRN